MGTSNQLSIKQIISELGLTEAKNNEMNNIIAKYNGNEQ